MKSDPCKIQKQIDFDSVDNSTARVSLPDLGGVESKADPSPLDLMERGYFPLWRKVVDWEWADDSIVFSAWVKILMLANWEPRKWQGITINRGQFVSSRSKLSNYLKLSEQQTRTVVSKLESTGELTKKATKRFSLYTIENYDKYFQAVRTSTKFATNYQPTTNQLPTTTKELKERIKKKEIYNAHFLEWYSIYPKKMAKAEAQRAFNALRLNNGTFEDLLNGTRRWADHWADSGTDAQFIPYPSRFLRRRQWNDRPEKGWKDTFLEG